VHSAATVQQGAPLCCSSKLLSPMGDVVGLQASDGRGFSLPSCIVWYWYTKGFAGDNTLQSAAAEVLRAPQFAS
jgi:hypothetical protein